MKLNSNNRKQNFSGIIILMAISLVGVIIIQLLWMKKAIEIKEEQFDQQINKILNNVAFRIERNQNAHMLSNMVTTYSLKQNSLDSINSRKDSILLSFKNYWKEKMPEKQEIKRAKDINEGSIIFKHDTVIVTPNSRQHISTFSSVSTGNNGMAIVNQGGEINFSADFDEVKTELNEILDQMVVEFNIRDIPLNKRFNLSVVEPTIAYELKSIDMPLDFKFAITNEHLKVYDNLHSKNFTSKDVNEAYKTLLFPNQLGFHSDLLLVSFPGKREFLYNSLIWLFIGSLTFTLIIIATFYYSIRFLVQQKKVSEVKTDFINNMTHEFKTPIATISLAADSILNPMIIQEPEKIKRFTQIIREENQRMNRQVESVLKMAMLDKKDFNLNFVSLNAHPTIAKAVENIRLQVEQKGGTISMDLLAENDRIRVDETHFTNVIFNLLDNANKYSLNTPPEIKISTHNINDSLYISVEDKGIGMDKETQQKIFDKFYRYNTGNVHTVKGFGLGLSYVKIMIMSFKGSIEVKSQQEKGSTFTLRLPSLTY